jgi:hypothetical protein
VVSMNWDTIRSEHVEKACALVASGDQRPRAGAKGLFILHDGQRLPAKHIQRLAYLLANGLSLDTSLKFSSGEGTIKLFRKLGFQVERETPPAAQDAGLK